MSSSKSIFSMSSTHERRGRMICSISLTYWGTNSFMSKIYQMTFHERLMLKFLSAFPPFDCISMITLETMHWSKAIILLPRCFLNLMIKSPTNSKKGEEVTYWEKVTIVCTKSLISGIKISTISFFLRIFCMDSWAI